MPVNRHVVRRIGENKVAALVAHEQIKSGPVAGIAANQTMPAKTPHVTGPRDRSRRIPDCRNVVVSLGPAAGRALARLVENDVDLGQRKAGQLDLELEVDELLQFYGQQLTVPSRIQRKLIVSNHVGTALGWGQV